jgi:hypothetical protein
MFAASGEEQCVDQKIRPFLNAPSYLPSGIGPPVHSPTFVSAGEQ